MPLRENIRAPAFMRGVASPIGDDGGSILAPRVYEGGGAARGGDGGSI